MSAVTRPRTQRDTLRLGTRASALARAQSRLVADRLTAATGTSVELVDVSTRGDVDSAPLASIGGAGVFVSAVREALLAGDVDLAVHSLKDLPTAPAEGVVLAAVPVREDPRDVVIARDGLTLGELPAGATVGTGSPRRAAQLLALGFGLDVVDMRGNVDTRLRRVHEGDVDAVLLARAGLARLHRLDEVTEVLDPLQMLPAPGQGALAVECRADDPVAGDVRAVLDDGPSRATVTAEREFLAAVEAGCSAPVGALAELAWTAGDGDEWVPEELWLRGLVVAPSGAPLLRLSATGLPTEAQAVGRRLAAEMLERGAAELIGAARGEPA